MKRARKTLCRVLALLLALLMIAGVVATGLSAGAANVTKTEKSYDIAVVFDNSGSMYINTAAWCRAKYAMEIFASMLNYGKDKLHIFPMWEVTTDGTKPAVGAGGSYAPIAIQSSSDLDKISNLFTVRPSGTPFAPVTEAYEYLNKSTADEKWLIVLTDGAFNAETRDPNDNTAINLQQRLPALASKNIKVQYLGFDQATELKSNEANNFYAKKSSDTSLKDDLISICNAIFQRSILPDNRLKGEKLNLDLSMKNLIVFAQGANAKILSLKDSSGKEISISLNSGQRKYSEITANEYASQAIVDTSLAGQVVTFAACPAGEYTLSYSGADKIQIFYEPDVDIDVSIVNSDGEKIENADDLIAGEYTVTSKIIDASTGADVTNHELMGKNVELKTYFKSSKDGQYQEYENGAKINMEVNEGAELYIEGQYLGKYKISSKDDPRLAWLSGFTIKQPTVAVGVELSSDTDWYVIKEKDTWTPIRAEVTLEGQPMTDEQLAATKLTVETTKGLKYRVEPIPGESAYNIYIAQDESGTFVEPEAGKYKVTAYATYTDEYGLENKGEADKISFDIQTYAKIWRILFWVVIFAIAFIFWLIFMLQKVMPKNITKDTASFTTMSSGELDGNFVDVEYRRKGRSLSISGSNAVDYTEQCSATFTLRPVDNRFTPPRKRRVAVIGIDSCCEEVKVSSMKYINFEGRWIKASEQRKAESGRDVSPIDQELSVNTRYELGRSSGMATLNCKTQTV